MLNLLLKNIDAFNTLYEDEIKTLNHQIDKFVNYCTTKDRAACPLP